MISITSVTLFGLHYRVYAALTEELQRYIIRVCAVLMQAGSVAWLEGGVWRPCLGTERKREPETAAETHGGPALKGEIDDTKGFPESECVCVCA